MMKAGSLSQCCQSAAGDTVGASPMIVLFVIGVYPLTDTHSAEYYAVRVRRNFSTAFHKYRSIVLEHK